MFGELVGIIFVTLTIASGQHSSADRVDAPRDAPILHRYKRFFPLFSVIRFPNSQCTASNSFNGTCYTRRECFAQGGTALGSCANGFGVCCVFQKSCGATTSANNTYFINPSYPTTFDGGDRCMLMVQKYSANVCQLRLDFLDFSLAQPTSEGICDYDLLSVSGGSSRVPRICGENSDQHVYVDYDGLNPIAISIDASSEYSFKRRWNIRVQQIACDSATKAPSGCLQYYTATSGIVMSFNYGTINNARPNATIPIGTREMADLNYGACVRLASGYCSLKWSLIEENSFSISGNGTSGTATFGSNCITDYIIIPNAAEVNTSISTLTADRFCGSAFTPKITTLKPYVLYVITDSNETNSTTPDTENKGFALMYRQMICSI
ncbi:uncharacterized protein LOC131664866 isoform X2 [Phymastichus coffea]|uniref:uncharacterized protein LOC131664866 isoform X2 n=1 Tax=Phymastichus coffea TaxID=108790 RepID=UPI00273B505F|nr:uncharacterized protein LOC131664866 isoform X2 [Phymastichus coffea]